MVETLNFMFKKELRLPLVIIGTVLIILIMLLVFFVVLDQYQKNQPQTQFVHKTITMPFDTETVEDWENFSNMPPQIVQPGIEGIVQESWKVVTDANGRTISEEKIDSESKVTVEVKNKIIKKGMLNYEDVFRQVRQEGQKSMDYWKAKDYESLYGTLAADDKSLLQTADIKNIIDKTEFKLDSFVFTGSATFKYEDVKKDVNSNTLTPTVATSPRLIASLPIEYTFTSKITGGQKVVATLDLIHEDKNVWKNFYLGPTKYVSLSSKQTGNDGSKTIAYPLSFEVELTGVYVFSHPNFMFFSYSTANTTKPSKELDLVLDEKTKQLATTTVTVDKKSQKKLTADLEIVQAIVKDDAQTAYQLVGRTITDKPWVTVPPGEKAFGWLKVVPAPSRDMSSIIFSVQCSMAGLYTTDVTFGTIDLLK